MATPCKNRIIEEKKRQPHMQSTLQVTAHTNPHSNQSLNSRPQATDTAGSLYTQKAGGGGGLWLLCPILIILALSCSSGEETSSQPATSELTVKEIPKRATTDVRDSYVLFSISAKEPISNYRLAVKETGTAAPTPAELTLAGLKRNLDTTAINVLIAQRLNAPMIAFAKNYFSDNAQQTLGANMSKHLYLNNFGLIYDDSATGTEAWIKESILKASTGYTLYGMKEGENQVKVLQTFVTDATLELPTTGEKYSLLDSTLEKDHIEIAINANELYIFPLQVQMKSSATVEALGLAYYIQEQSTNPEEYTHLGSNIVTIPNNIDEVGSLFGDEDPDITNVLLLFRSMESREESYVNGGTYVLINTIHNPNSFHYGIEYSITGSDPRASLKPSVLMKQ